MFSLNGRFNRQTHLYVLSSDLLSLQETLFQSVLIFFTLIFCFKKKNTTRADHATLI